MALSDDAPLHGLRPAVSYLFRAVRQAYGARAAAVLLSGMGKDGAQELLELRNAGALTFAQSSDSATVFGMPGEAIRLDAARHVLSPAEIGAALSGIAR
jgi:two-component system chemotaxis response regulator CheB